MEAILGITPTVIIPKPIGARIITIPVPTTMTIEERAKKSGLVVVMADKSKPKLTFGVIVRVSIDPVMEENFKVGQGVFFRGLDGTDQTVEGKTFRSFEFNEIQSTLEEEEYSEAHKIYVRHFLCSPVDLNEL
jgi:co-chaperonin GroES (HSP10)